ncbi:hypothetical protein BH11CYA1_BH11CYA1_49120 [soil metagenome]
MTTWIVMVILLVSLCSSTSCLAADGEIDNELGGRKTIGSASPISDSIEKTRQDTTDNNVLPNRKLNTPTADHFLRCYNEAIRATKSRRWQVALEFNTAALHEANQASSERSRYLQARLLQGLLYNRMDKPQKAFETLTDLLKPLTAQYGTSSTEVGTAYSELAEAQLALGQFKNAEVNAQKAVAIAEQFTKRNEMQDSERALGLSYSRLARALSKQGFNEDARTYFQRARTALAVEPGYRDQDLADELRLEALFYGKIGGNKTATQLFEKSCQLKEALADPEQPAHLSGEVKFTWEHGSPRSHEIIDHEFPLRYITANHVRVAVTVIDLWELASVLVCVTNLDDHRRPVGLGTVQTFHAVIDPKTALTRQLAPLTYIDHKRIDRIRRERGMWDLTQDRPWLANIQRTRNIRGLVPPSGHDLFRGPNVFGVWGEWPGVSHTVPTRVSVYPSRENIFNRNEDDDIDTEAGLIRNEGAKHAGLATIALEPMESRTGETFYIYPRGEDILVQVVVGNTTFEFPFHCRKLRIP